MVDDVLDVASTAALLGKPVGADMAAGIVTDMVVTCLNSRPELRGLLGSAAGSTAHARALHLLRTSGAINETINTARALAGVAAAELRAAAPEHASLREVATWPGHYIDAQLQAKIDPELRQLILLSGLPVERTA